MEQDLAKDILLLLNNNHTTVKIIPAIKNNFYSYMADTIFLSNINNNDRKRLDKTNLFCASLVTICHECIHSVQNKILHIANFVLSNLSLIFTIIAIVLMIIFNKPNWYILSGCVIVFLSIIIRIILEIDAIHRSLNLAEKSVSSLKIENIIDKDIDEARKKIKILLPIQIIRMVLDKIIMLIILVI